MELRQEGNSYFITNKKDFIPNNVKDGIIKECFSFAYSMVFGEGHHRNHRSGGLYSRSKGELFANTFQGKLAEYVTHGFLVSQGFFDIEKPDISIGGKGVWDDADLEYKSKKINVKSSSFFSNLLLLEKKDWNQKGEYIPNLTNGSSTLYDYFVIVRVKPDIKSVFKENGIFYSNEIPKPKLEEIIFSQTWYYDFSGVCSQKTILSLVQANYLLPQNALLNGKTKMDADNYYIQSGFMVGISKLVAALKQL